MKVEAVFGKDYRITIPKEIRFLLGLSPSDNVIFEQYDWELPCNGKLQPVVFMYKKKVNPDA